MPWKAGKGWLRRFKKDRPASQIQARVRDAQDRTQVHAQCEHEEADQGGRGGEGTACKAQVAGVPLEKGGSQHQGDLQDTGHAILHRARLAGADEQARTEGAVQQAAQGQGEQVSQTLSQDGQKMAEKEAEGLRIRVGFLAAQPDTRDDQEGVRNRLQDAHAAEEAAQDQVLLAKVQERPAQVGLQEGAGGVQAEGRGKRRRSGAPRDT